MELKRAAAPNGRQPAWPRRHRTTAKPRQRQRCTPPASSRRGPGAPVFQAVIAGQVRPKVGARHRAPFLQAVQSHARAVHPRARSVRGRARVVHRRARLGHRGVQSAFGVGVEFTGVSLFPSNVIRRRRSTIRHVSEPPTLVQSCPKNGRMMERMALRRIWDHMAKGPGIRRTTPGSAVRGLTGEHRTRRREAGRRLRVHGTRNRRSAGNQRVLAWWGNVLHQRCLVEVGEAPPAHRPQRGGRSPATIRPKLVTPKLVTPMSELSHHSRRFDRPPITSGLPRLADFLSDRRHVSKALTGTFAK